mmetsp:Transcript_20054/g.43388  ORF Transcript_20054/g.43388 Transcript_20054/m.43388 type:complete len:437 (-) Transcript_20054:2052-3362(-)
MSAFNNAKADGELSMDLDGNAKGGQTGEDAQADACRQSAGDSGEHGHSGCNVEDTVTYVRKKIKHDTGTGKIIGTPCGEYDDGVEKQNCKEESGKPHDEQQVYCTGHGGHGHSHSGHGHSHGEHEHEHGEHGHSHGEHGHSHGDHSHCGHGHSHGEYDSEEDYSEYSEDENIGLTVTVYCTGEEGCKCTSCQGVETIQVDYWDQLYGGNYHRNETSEYLLSFKTLENVLTTAVKVRTGNTLVPGCGDSPFSYELLHSLGLQKVISSDISEVAIDVLEEKYKEENRLEWTVDDMTESEFAGSTFKNVIDKSLIDCLFWVDSTDAFPDVLISRVLSEYHRVLEVGGCAIVITIREPDEFLPFIDSSEPHIVPEFQERREKYISINPCEWGYKILQIRTECNEEGLVPKNVEATDVTTVDPDQDPELTKRFWVYCLDVL